MASVNKVTLIGNLTRDPELRYTPKGAAVLETGIAVNRKWKDDSGATREEVTFIDVTFWGKTGETIHKWCKKGHPIYIEGRLQLDTWDDKTSGQKRSKLRVIGEEFQFLNPGTGASQKAPQTPPTNPTPAEGPPVEDDIPF